MNRETMKRRKETADTMRKIEAHDMSTKKPCETALRQQGHKAYACDFKSRESANEEVVEYIAIKYDIKKPIPGGD